MKVVFVGFAQEQLGIAMLSAVLRAAGHETALAFAPSLFQDRYYFDVPLLGRLFERDERLVAEIVGARPDLVAFSPLTFTYTWALDIARRVKARLDVPVIFGGVHASAVPEVCLESGVVDYVCVGEGEEAIVALCEALAGGARRPRAPIGNLWWRGDDGVLVRGPARPFIADLDALPLWDKALWEDATVIRNSYLTMASRGCPYRCTFCFNNYFARLAGPAGGKYLRLRGVDHVLAELHEMKRRYGLRYVEFSDDVLTADKAWVGALLGRYAREIAVPFSCLVHARFVDRDVARWLADAGCARVQMGIQTMDPDQKRRMLRHEREDHVARALEALYDAGLEVKLDHMFGLPGEPIDAQARSLELYARHTPAHVNTYWLSYLPGTDIIRDGVASGALTQADVDAIARGEARTFHHVHLGKDVSAERAALYRRYEVLFRALPLLPRRLRERARAEHVPNLPAPLANAVGFAFDLVNAAVRRDEETFIYAKHYAHHLRRELTGLLAGHAPQAPRPLRWLPPTGLAAAPRPLAAGEA